MAVITIGSKVSTVDIISVVAVDAGRLTVAANLVQRLVVAGVAMDVCVHTLEREVRFIVVEGPDQPGVGCVANVAIFTQRLFVYVVVGVTGLAVAVDVLESGAQMTGLASRNRMQADQGKISEFVIEAHILHPP